MTKSSLSIARIKKVWSILPRKRRLQLSSGILIILAAGFFEIVGIGLVLPFLGLLVSPEIVTNNELASEILQKFGITQRNDILMLFASLFVFATITAGLVRLIMMWFNTRVAFAAAADFGVVIFRKIMFAQYQSIIGLNTSELVAGLTTKTSQVAQQIIFAFINLIGAAIIMLIILTTLFLVEPMIMVFATAYFCFFYAIIYVVIKTKINLLGKTVAAQSLLSVKIVQEAFGDMRSVILNRLQQKNCKAFEDSEFRWRKSYGDILFIAQSPRFIIEAFGICLIASFATYLALKNYNFLELIPTLGLFVLAAQRLLPIIQQIFTSRAMIHGALASLDDLLELIYVADNNEEQGNSYPAPSRISFEKDIVIDNVTFSYPSNSKSALSELSLKIAKGTRIGIIGNSGSGKSTLLDIIAGLLTPDKGTIRIDGVALNAKNLTEWHEKIVMVPQNVVLFDDTILANIGVSDKDRPDPTRAITAAKNANIDKFINTLEDGYSTIVGENGIRLSGGQKQRIGIARALYKNSDVIIFDEATSALDSMTEKSLMREIRALSGELTIIMVAHRTSTLQDCEMIVKLEDGAISGIFSYEEILDIEKRGI